MTLSWAPLWCVSQGPSGSPLLRFKAVQPSLEVLDCLRQADEATAERLTQLVGCVTLLTQHASELFHLLVYGDSSRSATRSEDSSATALAQASTRDFNRRAETPSAHLPRGCGASAPRVGATWRFMGAEYRAVTSRSRRSCEYCPFLGIRRGRGGPDVGSFPPLPSSAAAATVAIIRRELESGRTVVTASPRPSAASLVLRLTGPLGAWQLERVRRSCGAAKLVLSVEPGWPLPPAISVVLHRFADVSLLVSEPTFAVLHVVRRLRRVAEVVLAGQAGRPEVVAAVALAVPEVPLRWWPFHPWDTGRRDHAPRSTRASSSRSHLPGTGGDGCARTVRRLSSSDGGGVEEGRPVPEARSETSGERCAQDDHRGPLTKSGRYPRCGRPPTPRRPDGASIMTT